MNCYSYMNHTNFVIWLQIFVYELYSIAETANARSTDSDYAGADMTEELDSSAEEEKRKRGKKRA
jgi:hypothetical protein